MKKSSSIFISHLFLFFSVQFLSSFLTVNIFPMNLKKKLLNQRLQMWSLEYGSFREQNVNFSGSSYWRCSIKKVLKKSVKFTGKHLCWSLFLIKLQAWWEKKLQHRWILRNFYEHLFYRIRLDDCFWIS